MLCFTRSVDKSVDNWDRIIHFEHPEYTNGYCLVVEHTLGDVCEHKTGLCKMANVYAANVALICQYRIIIICFGKHSNITYEKAVRCDER